MTDFSLFLPALAVVAVIVLVQWWRARPRSTNRKSGLGVDVVGDLLHACRGDRSMADRLIQHEMDRKPDLSRTGAALMALSRLRDDKR